ncbi:MAG TPA: GldG family protein [Candidatus Acidoferrum sp.]|nr:GldG family protein [Candidatus Acidoferrum sp.]
MAPAWLKARQTQYTAYAAIYILVVLAVLAAINFLADRYDKSYDSTSNKQFSLSDQTIKVVKGLKNDVQLSYFGPQGDFAVARDTLDRYSSLSPKLHVTYVDPERKPQVAKAAGFRSDSTIIVESGTRRESAKSLSEEEITGALIRSLKSEERTVCVLSAAGEHSIDDTDAGGYSLFKQILERDNYKVRTETLRPAAPSSAKPLAIGQSQEASLEVPKSCTVLVIAGPRNDYPAPIVNALKAYVEGGGRALFLLDTPLRLGDSEPPSENTDLLKLLSDWGVTANKDLALDLSGVGQLFRLGPEIPFIVGYESHPITEPLTRVPTAYPLSRSLDTQPAGKATISKLVATTDASVATTSISARGAVDPTKGKKGPLTLAVAGTLSGTNQGRFVVVGTSRAAQNSIVGSRSLGNRDLMVNTVNWLSSDEDLISIRPKAPEDRPLNMTSRRLTATFWLSVVVFPLAVIGFGLIAWWRRR